MYIVHPPTFCYQYNHWKVPFLQPAARFVGDIEMTFQASRSIQLLIRSDCLPRCQDFVIMLTFVCCKWT